MRDYLRKRYQSDPEYRLAMTCRRLLRRTLVAGKKKSSAGTFSMLGYTPSELMAHIELQFLPGMNWDNYGEWHIDHIVAVAEFLRQGVTSPAKINALPNLRPIWSSDNQAKGDKSLFLL